MPRTTAKPVPVSIGRAAPATLHEWVSFEDRDEDRTWVFDVTFLLSRWQCIFGDGCQGVLTGPAPEVQHGCCSYGAHFIDDDDVARTEEAAATLTADDWQLRRRGLKGGTIVRNDDGSVTTRVVEGACIFLNRRGFKDGAGCALHLAAVRRGLHPMSLKPEVCWQLPLRREDEVGSTGHVTSTIRQWDRRHWGDGGLEFHWWCTEAPEAFTAEERVYRTLREEIVALVGEEPYELVAAWCDARLAAPAEPVPHPAERLPMPKRKGAARARAGS